MHLNNHYLRVAGILALCLSAALNSFAQCSPQSGPPPSPFIFNTGSNGTLLPGSKDLRWTVTTDSNNAIYEPAVVMDSLPPDYYKSAWTNCRWISLSQTGAHSSNHHYFFKIEFTLPCTNPCGKSYDSN